MAPVFVEKLVLEANDGVREGLMTGVELVTSEDVKVGRVVEGEGAVSELEDRVMVRDEDDISEEVSAVEGDVIVEEALMDDEDAKVEIGLVEVVMEDGMEDVDEAEEDVDISVLDRESVDAVEDKVDVGTSVVGGELLDVVDRIFDEEPEDEVEVDINVDLVEDGIEEAEVEIEVGFKLVREVDVDVEVKAVDVDVLVEFGPDVLADTLMLVELAVVAATPEELAGH
ncbi:hypothetical protein GGU10DRAFT_334220 [Lentinula aff. detonsa]|uniref:Uncharacterized protein n=1 Tax=Lentinula aff. detonsa TaxID=2804958 RepID=A0AA38L3Q9_9AGAR|nr:hypothetical protein GGU10DRAFT_334220 [Lentinula aff. detonsa]